MNRPPRREVDRPDPSRKLSAWEKEQRLIAAGPTQRSDGRWQGCQHYIPAPAPITGYTNAGEPIVGSACVGRCWIGPGPHEHIEGDA